MDCYHARTCGYTEGDERRKEKKGTHIVPQITNRGGFTLGEKSFYGKTGTIVYWKLKIPYITLSLPKILTSEAQSKF
jgi:hypothetical protein